MKLLPAMLAFTVSAATAFSQADRDPLKHTIHDRERALPPKVDPGPPPPPAPAPSDAVVLFKGTDLEEWQHDNGQPAKWKVTGEGSVEVVPGAGDIRTRKAWGDAQLHIEFRLYAASTGKDQRRSNSGVFFGPYEIQVLDNYENRTYADGMAGSIYGQYPPLVNAARPASEWQRYDIIYERPRFGEDGKLLRAARFTVFHNGVLVQHASEAVGPTSHGRRTNYSPHGRVPLRLQDHRDDPMEYRNIWIRDLEPAAGNVER